jgi:neutral ceramidase
MNYNQDFEAGAAAIDITPRLGTIIGVDFLPHYARHIHDPVFAKAFVFKQNDLFVAIIVVDICIMSTNYMHEIKVLIQNKTGILADNILLASNHNHATGDVVGLLGGSVDIMYRNKLPALIVEAANQAKKNLKPAKVANGSINAPEFLVCRRYIMQDEYEAKNPVTHKNDAVKTNPFGVEHLIIKSANTPDPELGFLAIKSTNDEWIGIIANYGLHYAADWPEDSITGDYFGEFASQIKQKLGVKNDFVAVMSQGTAGDVNVWDFMNPDRLPKEHYAKTKLIGESLAQKVSDEISNLNWQENPKIGIENNEIKVAVRKPNTEELAAATKSFIENDFNNLNLNKEITQRIYDREQIFLNEYPDNINLALQVIKIGELVIGGLPGEFFAETGINLKKQIGSPYFSICLANSYGGYIPPAHEMDKGGYETWRARSSCMERDAEARISSEIVKMVNKVNS